MTLFRTSDVEHSENDFSLDPRVIECLWQMEERHFWHRARNAWILDALRDYDAPPPRNILEVGCGSGAVASALQKAGYQVTGVDTAERLVVKANERSPNSTFVAGSVAELPDGVRGPFSVVGFFDVLEHLERPHELLRASLKFAAPGALVLVTVPALRSLYTVVDELSGHKRRYERGEISEVLESVGVAVLAEHGIFAATLPFQRLARRTPPGASLSPDERVAIMRKALRVPAAPLNAALGWVARAERKLGLKTARGRAGASILAVGRLA
jgi:SAM-dependent methyltransferase